MTSAGHYEMLRELGRGGMATVYLARQPGLHRLVALKELGTLRAADAELARRFLREARMAGTLNHPNVVTVYDYFEDGGTPYIAMEYVEGGSLRPHVTEGLTLAQVGGVLDGLLAGLGAAERRGIVHRDLKPENALVTEDGGIKIADFGIGKAVEGGMGASRLTSTGATMGTPAYMAPEQARGLEVTPRTDLYAVGVMAFELLVGRAPFADTPTPMGVLLRQVNDPVPSVTDVRPDVDPGMADWIARLLVKEPEDRTPSADAARDELEELMGRIHGPRWRRAAALPVDDAAAVVAALSVGSPDARAAAVAAPPGTAVAPTPVTDRITPVADDGQTLPPRMAPAAAAAGAAGGAAAAQAKHRTPWRRGVLLVFAVVAVLAALAGAVQRGGGGVPPSAATTGSDARHGGAASGAGSGTGGAAAKNAASKTSVGAASSGAAATTPGGSSAGAAQQGTAAQGTASQGTGAQGAGSQGTAAQGAGSQGTASQGTASQGAGAQGAAPAPAAPAPSAVDPSALRGENADDGGDGGGTTGGGSGENADDGGDGP